MKHFVKRILCSVMAVCMLSTFTFVSAAEQASYFLSDYTATLTAMGNGEIAITVDVGGTGYMTEIGATEICVYESTNNLDFDEVAVYTSDDYPEMLDSGYDYYDAPIIHEGVAGRYYIASVTFYAANSRGSDTGFYTTVSCRAT